MSELPQTAYKVLTAAELATLEADGRFAGSADDLRDGFIHLSTAEQLEGTLAKHYAGAADLQLAAVDLGAFGASLRWEEARGGQVFPHLYEPLRLDTVIAYGPLHRADDGTVRLPIAG
ncbi:MAG: DUF952 domain-containing protein [Pseudomonadota bacterium]